jgi:hypothetical protein
LRRTARRIAAIMLYRIRSSRAAVCGSKAQHSEQEKKRNGDEGGDQQRTETTQAVGKEKEHRA